MEDPARGGGGALIDEGSHAFDLLHWLVGDVEGVCSAIGNIGKAAMLGEFEKATGIQVRMDAIDYGQLRQKQMLNMGGKTGAYDLVFAQEVWIPE